MITTLLFDLYNVLIFPKGSNYTLNEELMAYLREKKGAYDMHIFTSSNLHTIPTIRVPLDQLFTNYYSGVEKSLDKRDIRSFLTIAEELEKKPGEILFVDDTAANVRAAQDAGLSTIHFTSNEKFFRELNSSLCSE